MSISGIGSGADLVSQVAQGTTASDASISVLKKALDSSNSTGDGLASLVADVSGSGGKLNVYA
ncbi:MAG TPA: YjfB family protein [Candidatus Angelobacter sp.]|nr:YjfB family protein [Candidatus Angelobacter sp.]